MGVLAQLPFEDLGFASVDHHRELRTGVPEVVFGLGKTVGQIAGIVESIGRRGQSVLVTRIEEERASSVTERLPEALREKARVEPAPRFLWVAQEEPKANGRGKIAVVSAGTSDLFVAEEAARAAEILGNEVERISDVGVAGLHRLLAQRERIEKAQVVICVAGMDGALPSVLAGLISRPVIAVPTSVGSGASFGGVAALLTMLNSCASGVTVVNIDNGFGAAFSAHLINRKRSPE